MAVDSPNRTYKNPVACVAAFGRVFYGVDSTVYYSQFLDSSSNAGRCYQKNDPTSNNIPDPLPTDGGIIPIEGAISIRAIKQFRAGILVFAQNGVWYIYNTETGFTGNSFRLAQVSYRGIRNPRSIILAEGLLYYTSDTGIMAVIPDEYDNLRVEDITAKTIRTHYLEFFAGREMQGVYDEPNKQLVWWNTGTESRGLIYDLEMEAFYPQKQYNTEWNISPMFRINNVTMYPSWKTFNDKTTYAISYKDDRSFEDWGAPSKAYLVTGWESLGKPFNRKRGGQASFIFRKTETAITGALDDGGYVYDYPSACKLQYRWDFDNSDIYSNWVGRTEEFGGTGKTINLYNPMRRGFIPDSFPYTLSTGESVIKSKTTIRGSGDAVQFLFEAEDNKDLQLIGFTATYNMAARI